VAKHPEATLTAEQLADDFPTYCGVPITLIHDEVHDAECFLALGHHESERFLAAMRAYTRENTELAAEDYQLDDFAASRDYDPARWHTFYAHADRITVDEPDEHAEDWCVCDNFRWQAVQATGPGGGIIPTTCWRVD